MCLSIMLLYLDVFGFSFKPFVQTNITFGDVVIQMVIHYNSKQRRRYS